VYAHPTPGVAHGVLLVLYVPPLWYHHVTALEASISVSVWTQNRAIEIAAKVGSLSLPSFR
jgi:hypothetical protein